MKIMIMLQKYIFTYIFICLFMFSLKCPFKEMFMLRIITTESGISIIVFYVFIIETFERDSWRLKNAYVIKQKKKTTKSRLMHVRTFKFLSLPCFEAVRWSIK